MSKKLLSAFLLVGMVAGSTNAFASRARQSVLGTGEAGAIVQDGSLYYDHVYNIFYNPAYVNDFKNWAIIEKSNGVNSAAPAAVGGGQGGFVASLMNLNLGVYLNRASSQTSAYTASNPALYRPIDVILGGDMGVKWGLGLTYGGAVANGGSVSDLVVRAGISVADFEPFVNFKVIGKEKIGTVENKHKDMTFGFRYRLGEFVPYAAYRTNKLETAGTTPNGKTAAFTVGTGRTTKLGEGARLLYGIAFVQNKVSESVGNAADVKRNVVPLDIGVEGDATSWLTLRAGLQYRIMDKASGNGAGTQGGTQIDATRGRIGATVHVNKVDVDWALGNTGAAGTTENTAAGVSALDSQTIGFDNGMFTQLSLAYRW